MEPAVATLPDVLQTVGGTYPLAPLVSRWMTAIEASSKKKTEEFDQWADEAMQFFDGPLNWMWDQSRKNKDDTSNGFLSEGAAHRPQFLMSVNRLFEAVSMFGPVLYHQNPVIAVTPRSVPAIAIETIFAASPEALDIIRQVPMMEAGAITDRAMIAAAQQLQMAYEDMNSRQLQQVAIKADHAKVLEHYSNWIQVESDKKAHARKAITEAIITGMGMMETEPVAPPGGQRIVPRSRYRSIKDLFVDPDAKYWEDVTWIALKTCAPVNQVERKFGLAPGSIKGMYSSESATAGRNVKTMPKNGDGKAAGVTHDLVEYYEIYSKNGAGQNLKVPTKELSKFDGLADMGDFVYLAVCKNGQYPLNLPPQVLEQAAMADEQARLVMEQVASMEEMGQAVPEGFDMPMTGVDVMAAAAQWPVPYWADDYSDGGWPISRLWFHDKPGQIWPISMCKSCIGELRFVNWCMSFLADGVAAGSKIYVAVAKEAASQIKDQLMNGTGPFSIIELEKILQKPINEIIQFLQAPSFNVDIWRMVAEVNETIDKRLGLTELVYGLSSKQMRSAAEAQYRQQNINVRPDDMASQVEDWLSRIATREIQAMRWACSYDDVLPVLGEMGAHVFETQILTTDVEAITRDFSYRVQAGTARKPNKDTRIAQLNDLAQVLLPTIQPLAQYGVVRPLNAFISDMADAMEMDAAPYMLNDQDVQQLMLMQMPPAKEEATNESSSK
jgi:hypothetical protein